MARAFALLAALLAVACGGEQTTNEPVMEGQVEAPDVAQAGQALGTPKKAMKDARDLIEQYQAAKAAGQRLSQSLYGEIAGGGADIPADFVAPSGDEPPEVTINRFVDLYELQATQKIQQALANVVLSAPSVPSSVSLIDVPSHDETQLLARVQFAIGPIPCVMELEGVVRRALGLGC